MHPGRLQTEFTARLFCPASAPVVCHLTCYEPRVLVWSQWALGYDAATDFGLTLAYVRVRTFGGNPEPKEPDSANCSSL